MSTRTVRECSLEDVASVRKPGVIRGVEIGKASSLWKQPSYLAKRCSSRQVRVHASPTPRMDFISKNFSYKTLSFDEFIELASTEHQQYSGSAGEMECFYYLRSLGGNPRKDVANFEKDYPELADDLHLPPIVPPERIFSSIFRVSSAKLSLWTHYDVMDNILVEVVGRKKVVLFPPSNAPFLYLTGDKSQVTNIDEPDLVRFPKFAQSTRYECMLDAGDVLFIPALWFHHVTAIDFAVAVNVFWRHLPKELYDSKDPYGNKDPLPAQRALQMVDKATKLLDTLPEDHKQFYCLRLISSIENKLSLSKN